MNLLTQPVFQPNSFSYKMLTTFSLVINFKILSASHHCYMTTQYPVQSVAKPEAMSAHKHCPIKIYIIFLLSVKI